MAVTRSAPPPQARRLKSSQTSAHVRRPPILVLESHYFLLPCPASIKIEDKADESPRFSVPGLNLDSQNLDQTVMQR